MTTDGETRPTHVPTDLPADLTADLPPDPEAYDSPRAQLARARGLKAPYIPGGRDPDPEPGLREERYYGKLLLAMVIGLVFGGFVLGIIIYIAVGNVVLVTGGGG